MTRADRLTLVRQLAEEGLSARAIARRLKVSKDTVRRDLERIAAEAEPDDEPPAEPDDAGEPQVSEAVAVEDAPQEAPPAEPEPEPVVEPVAPDEPVARLPRRLAHPDELLVDLRGRPTLRRELAVLCQTGAPAEDLIDQATVVVASAYKQALASGLLQRGERFEITAIQLRPALRPARRAEPAEGA